LLTLFASMMGCTFLIVTGRVQPLRSNAHR
jgi:hypothetical protein